MIDDPECRFRVEIQVWRFVAALRCWFHVVPLVVWSEMMDSSHQPPGSRPGRLPIDNNLCYLVLVTGSKPACRGISPHSRFELHQHGGGLAEIFTTFSITCWNGQATNLSAFILEQNYQPTKHPHSTHARPGCQGLIEATIHTISPRTYSAPTHEPMAITARS